MTNTSLSIDNNNTICNCSITTCTQNSECALLANQFDSYYNNKPQITWTESYIWYLDYCSINGENYRPEEYDGENSGFLNYFECAVLNKGCYNNFSSSPCDSDLSACWKDTSEFDNCWIWLDYMGDLKDSNIFNDQWLHNILIEEELWDFTLQNPTKFNDHSLFISLTTCLYEEIIININQSCSNDSEQQCTLQSCAQQQNIMGCIFDIRCGYPLLYFDGGSNIVGVPNYIENCQNLKICNNNDLKDTIYNEEYDQFRSIFNGFTPTFNDTLFPKIQDCSISNISNNNNDANICINNECKSELSECNDDFFENINLSPGPETLFFCNETQFCPGQCSNDFFIIGNIQNKYGVKIALFILCTSNAS